MVNAINSSITEPINAASKEISPTILHPIDQFNKGFRAMTEYELPTYTQLMTPLRRDYATLKYGSTYLKAEVIGRFFTNAGLAYASEGGGIFRASNFAFKAKTKLKFFDSPGSASTLARGWQGKGTYPGIDNWRNITLTDGKYVVGGLPGQSNYYTTLSGLNRSGLNKSKLFQGLQVSKHPEFGYRTQVGLYRINGSTPAAFGTTYANPQFGSGGLPQIFIPDYSKLLLIKTIPLK